VATCPSFVARVGAGRVRPWRRRAGRGERRGDRALQALTQCILADVGNEAWSRAPADLVDLHERLDGEWRFWRQALER
jgi:hypothetical protein